jgi:hypothetical protein
VSIGFAAEGKGDTNTPVGFVAADLVGAEDNDCVHADSNIVNNIAKVITKPRCLLLMITPVFFSIFSCAMVAHEY